MLIGIELHLVRCRLYNERVLAHARGPARQEGVPLAHEPTDVCCGETGFFVELPDYAGEESCVRGVD